MSSEDIRFESLSPDESSERDSIYFSTIRSRHADHFFADMHNHTSASHKRETAGVRYSAYEEVNPNRSGTYPSLLANKLSFSRDLRTRADKALLRLPVLKQEFHNVSFELAAADVLALMYTKESEVSSLLKVLGGVSDVRGKLSGDVLVNGHRMSRDRLESTVALVTSEPPTSSLTVRQYLQINASFHPPMTKRYGGVVHLINKLMSDLGLIPVCNIVCSRLNRSQWQRVKVAAQLIRDPTILVCMDVLKDVDVHDQCFLIDYLREWAIKTNRIVLMAICPTSYQVLRMFSKTLILASGRVVYYGPPGSMQQYFESVGCPCPPYKNLCDYYVDLVTHDNLTSDASRESSVRIARLVNKWNVTAPPVRRTASGKFVLDLPTAGMLMKPLIVLRLFWFDLCNNRVSRVLSLLFIFFLSTCLSLYLSDLPLSLPEAFLDRNGFLELAVFYVPLIIGLVNLKKGRHRLKEMLRLSVFRKNCSTVLLSTLSILVEIPNCLISSTVFAIPVTIFTDFHRKSADYPTSLTSLTFSIFLTLSVAQLMISCLCSLSSEPLAYFFFGTFWALAFIFSGFPVPTPFLLKTSSALHFPSFSVFRFLYQDSPNFYPELTANLSVPLQLYSCGRTFLNTTQVTKGPCQKVSSLELLSFYGYFDTWHRGKSIIRDVLNSNLLISYFSISTFIFLFSFLCLYCNRSKLVKRLVKC